MTPMTSSLPALSIPAPTDPVSSAEHWGWLRRHELRIQRCLECGTTRNPPAELCYACHGTATESIPLPLNGRIFTWTRVWHPIGEAFRAHVPYLLAWIEIDHPDRPRFLGNIVGDPMQPVEIGDAVDGVFEDRDGGTILNWARVAP